VENLEDQSTDRTVDLIFLKMDDLSTTYGTTRFWRTSLLEVVFYRWY